MIQRSYMICTCRPRISLNAGLVKEILIAHFVCQVESIKRTSLKAEWSGWICWGDEQAPFLGTLSCKPYGGIPTGNEWSFFPCSLTGLKYFVVSFPDFFFFFLLKRAFFFKILFWWNEFSNILYCALKYIIFMNKMLKIRLSSYGNSKNE